jgi:predicted metal-dependent peptidase
MAARSAESVYLHLLARREEGRRGGHLNPRGHTNEDMANPCHEWTPEDNEICARWLRSGREGPSTEVMIIDLNTRLRAIRGPAPEEEVAPQENERLFTVTSEESASRSAGTSELERQLCHLRDQASARGVIPWRALLARFNHTRAHAYSATRHRRRFIHRDLYLPSYRGEGIKLVVALDTSGSTVELLPSFLKEVQEVLRACPRFELTLIQCSEHVSQVDHFSHKQRELIGGTRVVGGGGTRFTPVFERVERDGGRAPDLLLYFTDGAGPTVEKAPPYPVLWVLAGGRGRPAGFGVEVPLSTGGAPQGAWPWGA